MISYEQHLPRTALPRLRGHFKSYPHMDCYADGDCYLHNSGACSSYPHMDCYEALKAVFEIIVRLAVHTHIWIVTGSFIQVGFVVGLAVHTHIWIVTISRRIPQSSSVLQFIPTYGLLRGTMYIFSMDGSLQFIPTYGLLLSVGLFFFTNKTCSSYPHMDCYQASYRAYSQIVLAVHTHIWIVTALDKAGFTARDLAVHTHIWIVTGFSWALGFSSISCSSYPHMDCYVH